MDTWGTYTRETRNGSTGEVTRDEVLLQADPVNRARYERKGFTFQGYAPTPGIGPAIQACAVPGTSAAEQIWGFTANGGSDLDQNEIVKQAAEVALRKMTGTYTQAEAVAEEMAHVRGELKAPETPYAIVQGDILEGYEALTENGPQVSTAPVAGPTTTTGSGTGAAGTGATAPAP